MEKLTEVLAMHGFAVYVWPAFLLTALVMSILAVASLRALKRSHRTLSQLQNATRNET